MDKYKLSFSPIKLGKTILKNRIVNTPTGINMSEKNGVITDIEIDYFTNLSKNNIGMIIVGNATVSNVSLVVGAGFGASEGAIYFKEGGGVITYSNVYADGHVLGVKAKDSDAEALARITAGDLVINPIQFANNASGFVLGTAGTDADTTVTEADNTGAGSGATVPTWAAWTAY